MNTQKNKVILASAGCGDPELITVKALKYLQQADVILTDRLVSPELVNDNARLNTIVHYVGKQCAGESNISQNDINDLLVMYAKQYPLVVRLKGGDASLFSNILDELKILRKNNISYEIIPGISAAFGAAAYAAIPLTARGYSRGVRFLTLFDLPSITKETWVEWANTDDTLVFYMSGRKLNHLTQELLSHGIDTQKSIAVIQQATTPNQQTKLYSFGKSSDIKLGDFEHVPTLIIVGKVTELHQQFAWFKEQTNTQSYFDSHPGKPYVVVKNLKIFA